MTPEVREIKITSLKELAVAVQGQGFNVRKAAEQVASDIEDIFVQDNDIRWLQLHQQALLLHTEIRLLTEVRSNEINETINQLKGA